MSKSQGVQFIYINSHSNKIMILYSLVCMWSTLVLPCGKKVEGVLQSQPGWLCAFLCEVCTFCPCGFPLRVLVQLMWTRGSKLPVAVNASVNVCLSICVSHVIDWDNVKGVNLPVTQCMPGHAKASCVLANDTWVYKMFLGQDCNWWLFSVLIKWIIFRSINYLVFKMWAYN